MPMYNNKGPYLLENIFGTKSFCSCDMTSTPPYCGKECRSVGRKPYTVTFHEPTTISICGCGKSEDKPFCDNNCKKR